MNTKQCSKCKETLPLDDFCKYKLGKQGVYHYCRICQRHIRGLKTVEPIINLPDEEWRECVENTNYAVSNMGRVKRVNETRGAVKGEKLLNPVKSHGYMVTHLGVGQQVRVHRLVCRAFHGEPLPEQTDVHHIDHSRDNNRADNLIWCTSQQNTQWSIDAGRNNFGTRNGMSTISDDIVRQILHRKATSNLSNIKISKEFNVSATTVDRIVNNETRKHIERD